MAVEEFGFTQTFKAARDLSSYQYCPVYIANDGQIDYAWAAGKVQGILQNKPAAENRAAEVVTGSGVRSKLKVDGSGTSVDEGNPLESNASHVGVQFNYDADGVTETYMIGWALEASDGADEYITVLTNFCPASK